MADNNRMLIDATHPEETRVVVLRQGRVEEFDYESAARKQLRGNIYLAKVTRVEPSLQAAFVDYGGNRHGFLAFNEIHPDYYQIPVADRQALIEEEAAAEAAEEAAAEARADARARREAARAAARADRQKSRTGAPGAGNDADAEDADADDSDAEDGEYADDRNGDDDADEVVELAGGSEGYSGDEIDDGGHADGTAEDATATRARTPRTRAEHHGLNEERLASAPDEHRADTPADEPAADDSLSEARAAARAASEAAEAAAPPHGDDTSRTGGTAPSEEGLSERDLDRDAPAAHGLVEDEGVHEVEAGNGEAEEPVEQVGSEDALEELPSRPRRRPRSYKIQEVMKRRQVVLVQVVKEERGNKGAALTTYLSLAGRYTVLMPNTARGGGISRKITQPQDRKRLKAIAAELDVPEGMGLIIRTAGAARTKQEIKRDFEYLLRLWESVRELTLQSTAPSLVYEEGNLIKRSIRDLYNKDVEEIIVAGDEAHREAKDFMRMLMPSHAKNVIQYQQPEPLFTRFQIERQLNAMFSPYVTLRSGGYLVINQTEALVAIDVNSGKATREFSIEETALVTNCEAADEIARQLKLRDLAGLIVIDFIDMEEKRNNRTVERRLKEALRDDRARIQVGRISAFGLMEMSRQRLRTGVLEGSTSQCPHCQGTGIIRSVESVALAVLRGLEDAVMAGTRAALTAVTTPTVALYILNKKRAFINDMETRHGLPIAVEGSDKMQGANFAIEKGPAPAQHLRRPDKTAVNMDWGFDDEDDDDVATEIETATGGDGEEHGGRRSERSDRGDRGRRSRGGRDERGGRDDRGARHERGARNDRSARGEGDDHEEPEDRDERGEGDGDGSRRRRRRRRNRRGDRDMRTGGPVGVDDTDAREALVASHAGDGDLDDGAHDAGDDDTDNAGEDRDEHTAGAPDEDGERNGGRRRRRRGRRGGRRNRERLEQATDGTEQGDADAGEDETDDIDGAVDVADARSSAIDVTAERSGADAAPDHRFAAGQPERIEVAAREPRTDRPTAQPAPVPERSHPPQAAVAGVQADDLNRGNDGDTGEPADAAGMAAPGIAADSPDAGDAAANDAGTQAGPRTPRGELSAATPRIERVVVSSDAPAAAEAAPGADGEPTRRGWWQRRFGG